MITTSVQPVSLLLEPGLCHTWADSSSGSADPDWREVLLVAIHTSSIDIALVTDASRHSIPLSQLIVSIADTVDPCVVRLESRL